MNKSRIGWDFYDFLTVLFLTKRTIEAVIKAIPEYENINPIPKLIFGISKAIPVSKSTPKIMSKT